MNYNQNQTHASTTNASSASSVISEFSTISSSPTNFGNSDDPIFGSTQEQNNPFAKYLTYGPVANREFKSSLFSFLFSYDKENALSLYNAVNDSDYTNAEDLEFHNLDDALFIGMRNDVSFIFGKSLNLYEHQSTYNPNMPLRGLFYTTDLYKRLIDKKRLYRSRLIKLPTPKYVVFYNGKDRKSLPDISTLYLSDAFYFKEDGYEWKATVFNLGEGCNERIKAACKVLNDYCYFIETVRLLSCEMSLENAIIKAINDCISNHILRDFLEKYRWEVAYMSWTEYNEDELAQVYQEELEEFKTELEETKTELAEAKTELAETKTALEEKNDKIVKTQAELADKDAVIADKNAALADKDAALAEKDAALARKDAEIAEFIKKLSQR